jgi:hypothetical protein
MHNGAMTTDPVNRLRKICMSLPEAIEKLSYGEPGWFIGNGPQFVSLPLIAGDKEDFAFWCAVPDGSQQILIESDPNKFYVPPHRGRLMWLGVRPGPAPDWAEVKELAIDAYLTVAPKRLAEKLVSDLRET